MDPDPEFLFKCSASSGTDMEKPDAPLIQTCTGNSYALFPLLRFVVSTAAEL
jgi:hypothetical protein